MKLLYIVNARMPTEKAHGLQVMKMGEAFTQEKVEVVMLLPRRSQINPQLVGVDPFDYYSIQKKFPLQFLFCIDLLRFDAWLKKIPFPVLYWLQEITFDLSVWIKLWRIPRQTLIYSRSLTALIAPLLLRRSVVFEVHEFANSPRARRWTIVLLRRAKKVVTISEHLKKDLVKEGLDADRIQVAPDAVDPLFCKPRSKHEARKQLGIPHDAHIVMYTGNLYEWKGVYTLARSAKQFTSDTLFYFVGGSNVDRNIQSFEAFLKAECISNVVVTGHQPYTYIPLYQAAADVLVLPNSAKKNISLRHTSPLKLFEYMASQRPVVASDLPSLREILNQKNAILVPPDDPQALAKAIQSALNASHENQRRVHAAFEAVKEKTWRARAHALVKRFKTI